MKFLYISLSSIQNASGSLDISFVYPHTVSEDSKKVFRAMLFTLMTSYLVIKRHLCVPLLESFPPFLSTFFLFAGLWLVECDHVTRILASDWLQHFRITVPPPPIISALLVAFLLPEIVLSLQRIATGYGIITFFWSSGYFQRSEGGVSPQNSQIPAQ